MAALYNCWIRSVKFETSRSLNSGNRLVLEGIALYMCALAMEFANPRGGEPSQHLGLMTPIDDKNAMVSHDPSHKSQAQDSVE